MATSFIDKLINKTTDPEGIKLLKAIKNYRVKSSVKDRYRFFNHYRETEPRVTAEDVALFEYLLLYPDVPLRFQIVPGQIAA